MTIEQRVAARFKAAGWKPWTDPDWKNEGFKISLEADGRDIGTATMSKPKSADKPWLCRVYFGGGPPVVVGTGKVPAQAAADARQMLEKALSVLR